MLYSRRSAMLGLAAAIGSGSVLAQRRVQIHVNCGGPEYRDIKGIKWDADTGFSGGETYANTSAGIDETSAPTLYQSARFARGDFHYSFDVPNGSYVVRLKFAEIYFTKPAERVFNVEINGQKVLSRFDTVIQAGGPRIAIDKEFRVDVADGRILIHFLPIIENPSINAIEILQVQQ